jgi:hypothetical protein
MDGIEKSEIERRLEYLENVGWRIEHGVEKIERMVHRLLHPTHNPLTAAIAVQFTGDSVMDSVTLTVGQTSQASIVPLLADGVTPSGGVVSTVSYTFSDPSATVVINADGLTATVTGVAASTGPISGSAACTVADTDGVVSTWTQAFTVTTEAAAPPPAQLTQSISVQFSTPTP